MPMQATTTAPLFSATLRPERSLSAAGGWFGLLIAGIVGTPFLIAIPEFLVPGLVGFFIAASGLAVFSLRQSRRRFMVQKVTLWPDQLEILTQNGSATRLLQRFDPHQVRLVLNRDENERMLSMYLRHDEQAIELGGFLASEEQSSFAKAFGRALRQARRAG